MLADDALFIVTASLFSSTCRLRVLFKRELLVETVLLLELLLMSMSLELFAIEDVVHREQGAWVIECVERMGIRRRALAVGKRNDWLTGR